MISHLFNFQEKHRQAAAKNDLGALFNDPSLNEKYIDKETGEPKPYFTHKEERGCVYIKCHICDLQVVGKRNLDTHIEGKKHRNKASSYTMASKLAENICIKAS